MPRFALVLALSALLLCVPAACAGSSDEPRAGERATTEAQEAEEREEDAAEEEREREAEESGFEEREEEEEEEERLVPAPEPLRERKRVYAELARVRDRGVSGSAAYEQTARRTGVPVSSVLLVEREGSLRIWPLPATPKLPPSAVRAPARNGAAALRSTTRCARNARRTGVANLRWRPARARRGRQWIVVTNLLRGFEFGRYEAAGPFPLGRRSFEWRRVHGQSIHRWRVITRVGGRWLPSRTVTFTGPTCVAEFEE